jgi:D-3-phosphoglycerate dehydrogenase / 2-oxoglutarate reductase
VDNVDIAAATRRGIIVMNTPTANSIATAEQTMALMLAISRHTAVGHESLRQGEWRRSEFVGTQLYGKTLGIIGFGRIGRLVAERAWLLAWTLWPMTPTFPKR